MNRFVVRLLASALSAGAAAGQPAPFNGTGVTMGLLAHMFLLGSISILSCGATCTSVFTGNASENDRQRRSSRERQLSRGKSRWI